MTGIYGITDMMIDMKKTVFIILAAALAACTQEQTEQQPVSPFMPNQFGAVVSANTKVTIDEDWSLSWEAGDAVNVNDGTLTTEFRAASAGKSTVLEADGFEVDRSGRYYAVWPAAPDNVFDNGKVTLSVPSAQVAVPGEYPGCAAVSATSGETQNFVFMNVCSLVSFEITEPDVVTVILFGGNDEYISGEVNVDCSDASFSVISGSKTVRLYNTDGNAIPQGRYYIAILPGSYPEGMSLSVYKSDGTRVRSNYGAFDIARSKYVDLEQLDKDKVWRTEYTIKNAEELLAFLSVADKCTPETKVSLACDIDMAGRDGFAGNFSGTFDGGGYRISNWTCGNAGLFGTLSGTVTNLIIDGSCSVALHDDLTAQSILVQYNEGTIENVTNYASLSNKEAIAQTKSFGFGFIAGICRNGGHIRNCRSYGDIMLTLAPEEEGCVPSIGGIAGLYTSCADGYVLEGCTNYGNVSVTADGKKFRAYVGGVLGKSASNPQGLLACQGSIRDCHNGDASIHPAVTYTMTENVPPDASHSNIGGVVGYQEGKLSGCTNSGPVSFIAKKGDTDVSSLRPAVGGVAGCVVFDVVDCTNNGDVSVTGTFKTVSNPALDGVGACLHCAFGGVAGMAGAGTETPDAAMRNCVNNGNVSVDISMPSAQSISSYAGGVAGFLAIPAEKCVNNGELSVKSTFQKSLVGGVFGSASCGLTDCDNAADAIFDYVITSANGNQSQFGIVGGVVGYAGPSAVAIADCDNTGALIQALNGYYNNSGAYIGGVLGSACSSVGGASPDVLTTLTNCTNSAEIVSSTASRWRIGGIAGGTKGALSSCVNTGDFTITNMKDYSMLGGIVAYSPVVNAVQNCEYSGGISVSGGGANTYVGGLVARLDGGSDGNMAISGSVKAVISASTCTAGFAAGYLNGSKQVNLGSTSSKLNVYAGTSVNGKAITADNCKEKSPGYAFGMTGITDQSKIYNGNTIFVTE